MRFLVGIGEITDRLILHRFCGRERKRHGLLVARLQLHFGNIHRAAVDARRRTGLEPAHAKPEGFQALGQPDARLHAVGTRGIGALAGDDARVQIRARGNHDRFYFIHRAEPRRNRRNVPVCQTDGDDHRLLEIQMFLPLEDALHILLIFPPVCLRAQRMNGRTLAEVQHPVLDAAAVRRLCHLAAQRVQLAHEMSFSRAADCRVAGHVAHRVEIDRKDDRAQPHSGAGKPRFDSRVPRADHCHIIASRRIIHTHRLRFPFKILF